MHEVREEGGWSTRIWEGCRGGGRSWDPVKRYSFYSCGGKIGRREEGGPSRGEHCESKKVGLRLGGWRKGAGTSSCGGWNWSRHGKRGKGKSALGSRGIGKKHNGWLEKKGLNLVLISL